jgi:CRISPR-associated Csx2 family protein
MPRKVFLSFLGALKFNPYEEVNYFLSDNVEVNCTTRFAPEATLRLLCKDFSPTNGDKIMFFLTDDAKTLSWKDHVYTFKDKPDLAVIGLENSLKEPFQEMLYPVHIKEGKKEEEIWAIFNKIYEQLSEGDEVVFDITYGFRTSPMLMLSLIDYARFLNKITIRGIYYGAYEAKEGNKTPIWDLTAFSDLQRWTSAANDFLKHGKSDELALLATHKAPALSNNLQAFTNAFSTVRGSEIIKGTIFQNIRRDIRHITPTQENAPLSLLLRKIDIELSKFQIDDLNNGFKAVEWCLSHQLIQQGITLLQETIVTLICIDMNYPSDIHKSGREFVLNAFGCFLIPEPWNKTTNVFEIKKIHANQWFIALQPAYNRLRVFRNDINHGGFERTARQYKTFEKALQNSLNEVKNTLNF